MIKRLRWVVAVSHATRPRMPNSSYMLALANTIALFSYKFPRMSETSHAYFLYMLLIIVFHEDFVIRLSQTKGLLVKCLRLENPSKLLLIKSFIFGVINMAQNEVVITKICWKVFDAVIIVENGFSGGDPHKVVFILSLI